MFGPKIRYIQAREILDSRGNPTVEAKVFASRVVGVAKVPSGASTGSHEALELRDGGKRYGGKGVLKACGYVNDDLSLLLQGVDVRRQRFIDERMMKADGTVNKKKFGANAILSVSLACAQAAAVTQRKPLFSYIGSLVGNTTFSLPQPMMNILNGGAHAHFAIDVQECMIVPKASTFAKRIQIGSEVFQALKAILQSKGYSTLVGDEGGFAPSLKTNEEALQLIMEAIHKAGYVPGKQVFLAIDAAASEWYDKKKKKYILPSEKKELTAKELVGWYEELLLKYPLISIEDGLAEDDWKHWEMMTKRLKKKSLLVGDDLFVTNTQRLFKGIEKKVANAILIKPNQIGTLSETLDAILMAQEQGYEVIISHRSGETEDTFIADLAVGVNAKFIKTGSLSRSERICKYNRLMEIESLLLR